MAEIKLINNAKFREAWRVNGVLQKVRVRCGKQNCHCVKSRGHGWYWYLFWRCGSKLKSKYIPRKKLDAYRSALRRAHNWKRIIDEDHQRLINNFLQAQYRFKSAGVNFNYYKNESLFINDLKTIKAALYATQMERITGAGGWYYINSDYDIRSTAVDLTLKLHSFVK